MHTLFEKRKIRRVNYTRLISLPKTWLMSNGLSEGDLVECWMNEEGWLVLKPVKGESDAEVQ